MKTDVYNKENAKVGTMELPEKVFSVKWNPNLVHQVIVSMRSNDRKPVAHTKDRSEVRGGGKKPWAQKHTGRARHSSTRSPLWSGGGVTFGPRNERNFKKKINRKMKSVALYSVLSRKLKDNELRVVDELNFEAPKTKLFSAMTRAFFDKKKVSGVFVAPNNAGNAFRAGKNIPGVTVTAPQFLNTYDCMSHRYVFIDKSTIEYFEKQAKTTAKAS